MSYMWYSVFLIDKNECAGDNQCKNQVGATCINEIGSYQCKCKKGFQSRSSNNKICDGKTVIFIFKRIV